MPSASVEQTFLEKGFSPRKLLRHRYGALVDTTRSFDPDPRDAADHVFTAVFVGRIEPRIDRQAGAVEVIGLWWEDGFAPRREEGFVDELRAALRAYLAFAGAERLEWAPHLAGERRLVGKR